MGAEMVQFVRHHTIGLTHVFLLEDGLLGNGLISFRSLAFVLLMSLFSNMGSIAHLHPGTMYLSVSLSIYLSEYTDVHAFPDI